MALHVGVDIMTDIRHDRVLDYVKDNPQRTDFAGD